jgi:hypothetical protein
MSKNSLGFSIQKLVFTPYVISFILSVSSPCNTIVQAEKNNSISWNVTLNCHESVGGYDFVIFGEAPDANDGPPSS